MSYDIGKGPPRLVHENSFFNGLAHLKHRRRAESLNHFSKAQRQAAKVRQTTDGLCVQPRGQGLRPLPDGHFLYVVSPKGSLYVNWQQHVAYHSNVLSGRPVQAAGWLAVSDGRIVEIDSCSGHYQPENEMLVRTIQGLRRRGFVGDECHTFDYKCRKLVAAEACLTAAYWRVQLSDRPGPVLLLDGWAHVPWLEKFVRGVLTAACATTLSAIILVGGIQPGERRCLLNLCLQRRDT